MALPSREPALDCNPDVPRPPATGPRGHSVSPAWKKNKGRTKEAKRPASQAGLEGGDEAGVRVVTARVDQDEGLFPSPCLSPPRRARPAARPVVPSVSPSWGWALPAALAHGCLSGRPWSPEPVLGVPPPGTFGGVLGWEPWPVFSPAVRPTAVSPQHSWAGAQGA